MNFKIFRKVKKQHLLLGLVLGFVIILLPLHWAGASIGTIFINAVKSIVFAWFGATLIIAVPLSLGLLKLSEIIFTWSVNPELVGSVTNNTFVMTAWGIVRDFSNMFFILIFVIIGIATALRIKAYEVKKTLPRLIIIALLINFSPVICGLVIDAANIFMNFFLTSGAGGFNTTISLSTSAGAEFAGAVTSAWGNWYEFFNGVIFFRLLGIIVFNIFGAITLFLFAILFLVRNIALWILVILSPLAFFSYILPATKKIIFDKWKKEFIKWSFIGLTGSFFIYLSQLMIAVLLEEIKAPATGSMEFGGQTLNTLIKSSIPILFLVIGFFITVSTSAMGTKAISAIAKRGAKYFDPTTKKGRDAIGRLRHGIKETRNKVVAKIPGVQKISQRVLNKTPEEREKEWDDAGKLKKTGKVAGRVLYSYKRREKRAKKMIEAGSDTKLKKVESAKKKADGLKTSDSRRAQWKVARTKEERSGAMQSVVENREFKKYSKEEQKRAMRDAAEVSPDAAKKLYKAAPHVAIEMRNEYKGKMKTATKQGNFGEVRRISHTMKKSGLLLSPKDKKEGHKTFGDKLASSIQTKDIPSMDPKAFEDKEFSAGVAKLWGSAKVKAVGRELGSSGTRGIQQAVDEMGETNLKKENFSLFKYLEGNTGSEFGLASPEVERGRERRQDEQKRQEDGKVIPTVYQAREKAEKEEEELQDWLDKLEKKKGNQGHQPKQDKLGEEVINSPEGKITISEKAKKEKAKIDKKLGEDVLGGE